MFDYSFFEGFISRAVNMLTSHSKPGRRTNEDVFFAYYPRLLEWAMQITHRDREEAEDLVHDLYLRATRISRSLDEIESLDSYLFRVLRNLYYSRLRRAGRDAINDLSIVDYDSVEHGLAVADRRELLFVRAHLREICRYACQRKSTARSASVLILRFFLGYYASEIMKILQAPRSSVDRSLQVARHEARLFLERPGTLRFFSQGPQRDLTFSGEGEGSQKIFSELQEAIFSATEGQCFAPSALKERYAPENQLPGFTAPELAHLVSCQTCLDQVNGILDLPLLAERSPEYGLDRNNPPGSGGAAGSGTPIGRKTEKKGPSLRKMERRARELYEHRPDSLQVVVDGEVRTSQKVTAEKNELHLKLARKEEPAFIEVFSEQGFCLAYLHVADPAAFDELEQAEEVSLSDNRTLTLTLTFAADAPIVHVLYRDPVVAEAVAVDIDAENVSGLVVPEQRFVSDGSLHELVYRPEKWLRRTANRFAAWLQGQYPRFFIRNMNPYLASAAIFMFGALVCLCLWLRSASPISANTLLQHAEAAERVSVSATEQKVIYQRVRIQTAVQSFERVIHRDASGRRKPKRQPLDKQTEMLQARLARAGVSWNEPLSAETYHAWREHSQVTGDSVRQTGNNLLTLTTTIANADVAQESLTVRANDFHPVARTISFRDTGNVEIAELDYAVVPWSAVDSNWFEPMDAMAPNIGGIRSRVTPHPGILPLTEEQIDEADLGAMLALHQIGADGDNRIQIVRSANGVQVKGVVEGDARKRELEAQLNLIPHVIPAIFTFQELESQPRSLSGSGAQSSTLELQSDEEQVSPLTKFLLSKGQSRDEMSRLANRLSDSTNVVNRESSQLAELMHRYGSDQQLTKTSRTMLDQLIAERKASILAALNEEEHSLADAGIANSSSAISQGEALDLEEATKRNRRLCEELVFGDATHGRSALDILPELARTIHQLHAATLQLLPPTTPRTSAHKEQ